MSGSKIWHEAKLFSFEGVELGTARVPREPMPPGIILWNNRYFTLTLPNGEYGETRCYVVPEAHAIKTNAPLGGLPFKKGSR